MGVYFVHLVCISVDFLHPEKIFFIFLPSIYLVLHLNVHILFSRSCMLLYIIYVQYLSMELPFQCAVFHVLFLSNFPTVQMTNERLCLLFTGMRGSNPHLGTTFCSWILCKQKIVLLVHVRGTGIPA